MNDFKNLYEKLIEYSGTSAYPFHMPGHKRQMMFMENPYRFDLTEIDGFDNLHEAGGIFKRRAGAGGPRFTGQRKLTL